MISRFKYMPPRRVAVFCSLIFAMLLVACGGVPTSTSSAASTARPSPTAKPSPTATPTPKLKVYTGKGYSIGYPEGWKVTPSAQQIDFTDASEVFNLTIILVSNPGGAVNSGMLMKAGADALEKSMKNVKEQPVPPTTIVGGDTWVQKAIRGTGSANGVDVDMHMVMISDNHPAHSTNTQNFIIIYGTTNDGFDTGNTSYFQPMLKSFKFI